MCGLIGYINPNHSDLRYALRLGLNDLQTRGPDDEGIAIGEYYGLGFRRLAIVDLSSNASQPMEASDGRSLLAFNGEIYNHRQLRELPGVADYPFRSTSDAESLLALLVRSGSDGLALLRGMFAFAHLDLDSKTLLLARDPLGIKPLYYGWDREGCFWFSSEISALLSTKRFSRRLNWTSASRFLAWGHVPEPESIVEGIRNLPAGVSIRVGADGAIETTREYHRGFVPEPAIESITEAVDRVRGSLEESVAAHLLADVPVGLFLSAGIDSTVIAEMSSRLQPAIHAVTLDFPEANDERRESIPASDVARAFGLSHQTIEVDQRQFALLRSSFFSNMDQPTVDGLNSFIVSWAARQAGLKVALSGLGSDELFGGYFTFSRAKTINGLQPIGSIFPRAVSQQIGAMLSRIPVLHKYAFSLEYGETLRGAYFLSRCVAPFDEQLGASAPPPLRHAAAGELELILLAANYEHGDFATIANWERSGYMRSQLLKDTDWASMAHSVEVRTPLCDQDVFLELSRTAEHHYDRRWPKHLLRKAPRRPLPRSIMTRPKTGFSLPLSAWMGDEVAHDSGRRAIERWSRLVLSRWLSSNGFDETEELCGFLRS